MGIKIETISAITLKVVCMETAVEFYRDVLGMKILYGGPGAAFSSLQMHGKEYPILNLETGRPETNWGRMIFQVADVDSSWRHFKEKGFEPERPQDASWGERYFHMRDPDGHELSFARRLQAPAQ